MDAWIKVEDLRLRGALNALIALGQDATPAMQDIATIGENSTRMRFRTETSPDGVKWKPSLRAQLSGGRTLTKDGHLAGSISSRADKDSAEWGVNRVYAAVHQFGDVIKAKNVGSLHFRLANGAHVTVASVKIPDRPYLGLSEDDAADMLDALTTRISATTERGANVAGS